jgi:hypothetical protein
MEHNFHSSLHEWHIGGKNSGECIRLSIYISILNDSFFTTICPDVKYLHVRQSIVFYCVVNKAWAKLTFMSPERHTYLSLPALIINLGNHIYISFSSGNDILKFSEMQLWNFEKFPEMKSAHRNSRFKTIQLRLINKLYTDFESYFMSVSNFRLVCLLPIYFRFWSTCMKNLKTKNKKQKKQTNFYKNYIWVIQCNGDQI